MYTLFRGRAWSGRSSGRLSAVRVRFRKPEPTVQTFDNWKVFPQSCVHSNAFILGFEPSSSRVRPHQCYPRSNPTIVQYRVSSAQWCLAAFRSSDPSSPACAPGTLRRWRPLDLCSLPGISQHLPLQEDCLNSFRVDNLLGKRCEAILAFADPAVLPITWSFAPMSCVGSEVIEFTVPAGVPNGDAFVAWSVLTLALISRLS